MALSLRRARAHKRAASGRLQEVIVLSGGGSLGAAQVGSLRALYEAGIRPDAFVGCSVGALNAAFLAVDPTSERLAELEAVWRKLDRADIFGRNRRLLTSHPLVHAVRRDDHLYEPDSLRALVRRWVPLDNLADTAVPCHVVTTDLFTGQPAWWCDGDPVTVLTASACLPALFPPVLLGDCSGEVVGCDLPRTNHEASLFLIEHRFGWISSSEEFVKALQITSKSRS